jgi:hypothetical protein
VYPTNNYNSVCPGLCAQTARKGVTGRYIILCLPQDCADRINREQVPYINLWAGAGDKSAEHSGKWRGVAGAFSANDNTFTWVWNGAAFVRSIFSRNRCHPHTNALKVYIISCFDIILTA